MAADSLGSGHSVPSALPSVRPVPSLSYDQKADMGSGLGMLSSSSLYGYGSLSVCVGIFVTYGIIIANYYAQFSTSQTIIVFVFFLRNLLGY